MQGDIRMYQNSPKPWSIRIWPQCHLFYLLKGHVITEA